MILLARLLWSLVSLLYFMQLSQAKNSSTAGVNVGSYILQGLSPGSSDESTSTYTYSNVTTSARLASTDAASPSAFRTYANSSIASAVNVITAVANATGANATLSGSDTETITRWSTNLFKEADMLEAKSCWSNYSSWWMTYASPCVYTSDSCNKITTSGLYTYTTVTSLYPWRNASTYKLCDGFPRADYPATTTTLTTIQTTSGGNFLQQNGDPMPPHCEPDNSGPECAILWFGSNINELSNETVDSRILYAACGDAIDGGLPCLIQGGPARLVYFPVTTTSGGFCAGNGSTVTRTDAPSVISALGTEFTSGTAYVSFETLYAAFRPSQADKAGALQIGPTFSNAIFSFRSDEISTNCYTRGFGGISDEGAFGTGTQLNFADLNYPISASAYQCQDQCYSVSTSVCYNTSIGGGPVTIGGSVSYSTFYGCSYSYINYPDGICSTIWDNFNPLLAVPTRLRELAPEWSTCSFWHDRQPNVIFDPPTALHQVDAAATPTLPNAVVTTAASPSPTVAPVVGPTGITSPEEPSPTTNVETLPTSSNPETIAAPNDNVPQISDQLPTAGVDSNPDSPSPSNSALEQEDPSSSATADPVSFILEHLTALNTMSLESSDTDLDTIAADNTAQDFTIAFSTAPAPEATAVESIGAAIWTPSVAATDPVAVIDLGSTTVQATLLRGSALAVGGSTIAIGQAATVGDAQLSLASSGDAVHITTATSNPNALESPIQTGAIAMLHIGNGNTVTASFQEEGKTVVVDGTTLSIGGSAATINGETVTLASGGVVAGGSTYAPTPATALDHFLLGTALVTLPGNGGVVTASFDANSHVAEVAGQTVTLGGAAVTIDGLAVSLASDGLVVNSRTYTPTPAATASEALTTLLAGDHTFTGAFFSSKGLAVIGGTTLTVGGSAVTFDGIVVTAATNGLKTLSSGSQAGDRTTSSSTPTSTRSSSALPSALSTSTSAAAKCCMRSPTLAVLVVLLPSLLGVCEHIL